MCAYQENNRDVEEESHEGVHQKGEDAERPDVVHGHARNLDEQCDNAVDGRAGGGVVVDGDQGIHLELGGAQDALHHDEAQGFGDDTTNLDCEGQAN